MIDYLDVETETEERKTIPFFFLKMHATPKPFDDSDFEGEDGEK